MGNVTIIIPTLNEEENVDLLLKRVLDVQQSSGISFKVLLVDSASTDNTCDCVRKWERGHKIQLLQCDVNVGLAPAVMAAAAKTDSEYVLVMDADLSHPPEKIPDILEPLLAGDYDMVIGSRYIPGGAVPDWPFSRKVFSKIATLPALCFCNVKDPLAGFFALRRTLITSLSREVPGFKIGLAVLAEYQNNIRVKEIPITFRDRDYGKSKMNKGVIYDYLRQLAGLAKSRVVS